MKVTQRHFIKPARNYFLEDAVADLRTEYFHRVRNQEFIAYRIRKADWDRDTNDYVIDVEVTK